MALYLKRVYIDMLRSSCTFVSNDFFAKYFIVRIVQNEMFPMMSVLCTRLFLT